MRFDEVRCVVCDKKRGESYCLHCRIAQNTAERLRTTLGGASLDEFKLFAKTMKWLVEAEHIYTLAERNQK